MLAGLGQAATVAQLAGMDAGGLISMILQAAVTTRENKKMCEQLAHRVAMIADLMPHLHDPEPDVMRLPLAGLEETLREAHELVASCQRRGAAYRFVMARRQAHRFRDVQGRIDSYLLIFPVVSHIAIARRLDRMHHVQLSCHAAVRHATAQEEEEFTFPELTPSSSTTANLACFGTTLGAMGGSGSRVHDERVVAAVDVPASPIPLKHIARLFRWRVEKEKRRQLFSEYVNNGTLRQHLHGDGDDGGVGQPSPVRTSWRMRVEVLLGASRAIEDLHRCAAPVPAAAAPVLRRRVSSCNILLDARWKPRLSDLRTCRTNGQGSIMDDDADADADAVGQPLVLAVERAYRRTGRLKPAASVDVYNLGVVTLEVLTGKWSTVTSWDEEEESEVAMDLASFALPFIEAGQLAEVLDRRPPAPEPTPRQLAALELVARMAARCLGLEVEDRPAISDVVAMFERALKLMCSWRMFA